MKKKKCLHDHKNAIHIGGVDYMCPLCKELINPLEWFFMNSFEFVEVKSVEERRPMKKSRKKKNEKLL